MLLTRTFLFYRASFNNTLVAHTFDLKKICFALGADKFDSNKKKLTERENKNICDPGHAYLYFLGDSPAVTRIFVFSGLAGVHVSFVFSAAC